MTALAASDDRYGTHVHGIGAVLTGRARVGHIEARHPARRGAKSPMQTLRIKTPSQGGVGDDAGRKRPGPGRNLSPLLAGAATAAGGAGALLALIGSGSPLRGPLALFFLLVTPAAAIAVGLRGLDPFGRAVAALAGAVALDMLVAQGMLAVHRWSVRGGLLAVTALSLLLLAGFLARVKFSSKNHPKE
ncbi:hypothetical protein ACIPRD_26040 [Streptomyces sp. NPDC090108]|uniref:hypothetical protein n=1 Tax=Streptomyces sp. NPDC090108 TaxID=3365947 RepID=UPI00381DECB1